MKKISFPIQAGFKAKSLFSGMTYVFMAAWLIGFYSCSEESNPDLVDYEIDTDGDGIIDSQEVLNGTDRNNPCDPVQNPNYGAYDPQNLLWAAADCDNDGTSNADELAKASNPYSNELLDLDGDGIADDLETLNGTDPNDPCDPGQAAGYNGYNATNALWLAADCDADGILNADEIALDTDPYFGDTEFTVPEFLSKLSELHLFKGDLYNLELNTAVYEYSMTTPLYTDYAYKLRTIAMPIGTQMTYDGEGLILFPDGTILAKTFYYLNDERNPASAKKIIETRILIKQNGSWAAGNYVWNEDMSEAFLDEDAHSVQVSWINMEGNTINFDYTVPPGSSCLQCHGNNGEFKPVGPKSRALNFVHNGVDQMQFFKDNGLISGAPDSSQIAVLPDWEDETLPLDDRARAYLDVNCAHCHQPGGSYNLSSGDNFDFRFETSFEDSNIYDVRGAIQGRMSTQIPGYFMPLIGTNMPHAEGIELINQYIESLD